MVSAIAARFGNYDTHFDKNIDEVDEDGLLTVSAKARAKSHAPDFLPTWDPSEKYGPLTFFKYNDPGLLADASFPNLFPANSGFQTKNITPKFGTEVINVQLLELNESGKNELALFIAQRGVAVFRNQNFASKGPRFATDFGRHFGRLHIHPTSGAPKGVPELHITYRRPEKSEFGRIFANRNNNVGWHSDVSYELQPPGITFFSVLEGPEAGGDTIFADTVEAHKRLSPEFQKRLEGLHVLHTSADQASNSRSQGGIERRVPVSNIHPLVRVHPVTKEKAIFLNRPFSRRIVELKEEESRYLLDFLLNLIESSHDLQLRANWEPNTVTIWDNRRSVHSAINDWDTPVSRHAFRITPQAERPVADLANLNKEEYNSGDVSAALNAIVL